jgi:hypothetical protein
VRFENLLRAHGFIKTEHPPDVWEAETEDVRFVPLLGEMIAAPLSTGAELGELTLNVSNVVVEHDPSDEDTEGSGPLPGEYVAVTVKGRADLGPDCTWRRDGGSPSGLLGRLVERLETAGAHYAYVRRLPPEASITVFLARRR